MLRYVKLTVRKMAFACALAVNLAHAGLMGSIESIELIPVCVPGSNIIPCATHAIDFGIYALYLKPNYGEKLLSLGLGDNQFLSKQITNTHANWDWGYKLEASYHFGTGKDLNLNWSHFDQPTTKTVSL